jgi:hypothetical protein
MTQKIPSELIADDAIDSEHYAAGSIDTAHIADDQITLAKMAGGTDGNIISYDASGNPVAIATGDEGEILTSAGAGAPPAFAAAAGGGGITQADSWELTTSFTGDKRPITDNLAPMSGRGFGTLGDGMSQSSGIFTFPETGFWAVLAFFNFRLAGDSYFLQGFIYATLNDADYAAVAEQATHTSFTISVNALRTSTSMYTLLNVTNVANVKVRFEVDVLNVNAETQGGTDGLTSFHFIRLGDST